MQFCRTLVQSANKSVHGHPEDTEAREAGVHGHIEAGVHGH